MALLRRIVAWSAALALAVPAALVASTPRAGAAVPVLVIDGKGWGHGVGMAQDGAFWMAKGGATLPQILGHFYPGTALGTATGTVRVAVRGSAADAVLAFPSGGEVRDALSGTQSPGFPVKVPPGEQVRIRFDGSQFSVSGGTPSGTAAPASSGSSGDRHEAAVRASRSASAPAQVFPGTDPTTTITIPGSDPSTTSTTSPPPSVPDTEPPSSTTTTTSPGPTVPESPTPSTSPSTTTTTTVAPPADGAPPADSSTDTTSSRPLWAVPSGSNGLVAVPERARQYRGVLEVLSDTTNVRVVNQLDVETYLKGMGEVRDPSWPLAALQTQAVAARTYALRAMAAGGELCDDDRCQVYLGAQAEYAAMNKAVDSTAKKVVIFNKTLASTVFSANAGGFSATPLEGFGSQGAFPYLQAAPYTTKDPMPWTVRIALSDLAARFGYPGTISDVKIAQAGPSGRAINLELDGDAGPKVVTGLKFAAGLGLRSTLFALHIESADVAPPPPAAADLLQAPPDQAAALAAAPPPVVATPLRPFAGAVDAGLPSLSAKPRRAKTAGTITVAYLVVLTVLTIAAISVTPEGRRVLARLGLWHPKPAGEDQSP